MYRPPKRGDVVATWFRESDGTYSPRLVLLLQPPEIKGPFTDRLLGAPITSALRDATTRLTFGPESYEGHSMGLTMRSQVCLDDISAVPLRRARLVGFCPVMDQVDTLLRKVVGLST